MTEMQLNRAVAHATGESLSIVRMFGFDIADPEAVFHDPVPARHFQRRCRYHRRAGGAQRESRLVPRRRRVLPKQPVLPPKSALG